MSETFDNKRAVAPVTLQDVDVAFMDWWDKKLSLDFLKKDSTKSKIPVVYVTSERWQKAREEGIRNEHGTIITPVIAVSRVQESNTNTGEFARTFADTKQEHVYSKEISPKSSKIQNLIAQRTGSISGAPIYEVFVTPPPIHLQLTYEVKIWCPYIELMNTVLEKIDLEMDFKSEKSFTFSRADGFYWVAYGEDDIGDDSNLDEFTGNERVIRKTLIYNVSAHLTPESDQRESKMKRYWSQTKLVVKNETALSQEEFEKLTKT